MVLLFLPFLYLLLNYCHYLNALVTSAKALHINNVLLLLLSDYPAEYEVIVQVGVTCKAQWIA